MMPFLAAIVVFAAVLFLLLALRGGQPGLVARLEGLRGEPRMVQETQHLSLNQRLIGPVMDVPVQQLKRILPSRILNGMQQKIILAGEPMTLNTFLTLRLVCFGTFLLLPLMIILTGAVKMGPMGLLILVAFTLAGLLLPQLWLQQRVGQRQSHIIKSLPDAFDLITTCVEAGLGLDAALARVAEKAEGPFADELSRTLREISLGKMRKDALREFADRTGVPDLLSFVTSVIQAEQMGSSVGTVLRVQSEQLRVRRRQRAEAQAYRAPVKMLFPLVLCIFPSLFIVILGPAVITIMHGFPSK